MHVSQNNEQVSTTLRSNNTSPQIAKIQTKTQTNTSSQGHKATLSQQETPDLHETLQNKLTELKEHKTALREKIEAKQEELTTLKTKLAVLSTQKASLSSKKPRGIFEKFVYNIKKLRAAGVSKSRSKDLAQLQDRISQIKEEINTANKVLTNANKITSSIGGRLHYIQAKTRLNQEGILDQHSIDICQKQIEKLDKEIETHTKAGV